MRLGRCVSPRLPEQILTSGAAQNSHIDSLMGLKSKTQVRSGGLLLKGCHRPLPALVFAHGPWRSSACHVTPISASVVTLLLPVCLFLPLLRTPVVGLGPTLIQDDFWLSGGLSSPGEL